MKRICFQPHVLAFGSAIRLLPYVQRRMQTRLAKAQLGGQEARLPMGSRAEVDTMPSNGGKAPKPDRFHIYSIKQDSPRLRLWRCSKLVNSDRSEAEVQLEGAISSRQQRFVAYSPVCNRSVPTRWTRLATANNVVLLAQLCCKELTS